MQAKSRVRIEAQDGRIYEATAKVGSDGKVTVNGKALALDAGKVKTVTLEQRAANGRITSAACGIAANGAVKVKGANSTAPSADLAQLAPVPSTTARQAAIPAYGAAKAPKPVKPGVQHVPYDKRDVASLSRNDERKGWELRLRKSDQLTPEQLAELHAAGWRWYGGRLQAFCLAEKNVTRESLTLAQGLVTGFNSGALKSATELAAFAAAVGNGHQQGSSFLVS